MPLFERLFSSINDARAGAWVADLVWPGIEQRISQGAIAVLPIGAAAKEHGLHLPMATDYRQAEWLAARLIETCNVLVWPTINYGYYPAFADFPGSCTLRETTFANLVAEVIDCIAAAGANRLLILNTGISTMPPLARSAASAAARIVIRLAHVYRGARYLEAERSIAEQAHGSHADELETSIMLAIAPARVMLGKARTWTSPSMGAGKFVRDDPAHPNYSPDGIYGDPTLATQEKGESLLSAMLADLNALIAELNHGR